MRRPPHWGSRLRPPDDLKRLVRLNTNRYSPIFCILAAATFFLLAVYARSPAVAQVNSGAKKFKDQAELSVVNTSGNTDTLTLSLKNTLLYDFSQKYTGSWKVLALYGEQNNQKNAERYSTDLRLDNFFPSGAYFYLLGRWSQDKFAGFDNRYSLGPGIGQKFIDGPKHYLRVEIGCNYTREDYTDEETDSFIEGRSSAWYDYFISDDSKLSQTIEYLHDFEDHANFKIATETAVTAALNKLVAIKLAYEIRYQNRPAQDRFKKTDTVFSGSLVVSY